MAIFNSFLYVHQRVSTLHALPVKIAIFQPVIFLASTSAAAAPRRAARSGAAPRNRPLHTAGPSSWGRPSANPSAASPAALWYNRNGDFYRKMAIYISYNL